MDSAHVVKAFAFTSCYSVYPCSLLNRCHRSRLIMNVTDRARHSYLNWPIAASESQAIEV